MTVELRLTLDIEAVVSVEDAQAGDVRDRIEEAYRAFTGTLEHLGLDVTARRAECAMNKLPTSTQETILSALVEGSSIRSVERMTGVHQCTRAVAAS